MSPAERTPRQRLDQLLVERGLAESRTRAQALIMGGHVRVGEGESVRTDRKPGDLVETTIGLEVEAPPPFVSRGGIKLRAALDAFGVEPVGLVCLDVGSSTGGFTDLLLQRDASRVYAVDVGRGQLAETLRHDPRVVSMERTNAREPGSRRAAHRRGSGNHRRFVHLAGSNPGTGGLLLRAARRTHRRPGQAPVRGRPQAGARRRGPRSGHPSSDPRDCRPPRAVPRPGIAGRRCVTHHRPGREPRVLRGAGRAGRVRRRQTGNAVELPEAWARRFRELVGT